MAAVLRSPEVAEAVKRVVASRTLPKSIRRSQRLAGRKVITARLRVLREARKFDAALKTMRMAMRQTSEWERELRALKGNLVAVCERVRDRAALKERAVVLKIKRKREEVIRQEAQRVPLLRRLLSAQRSGRRTQAGNSASESELPPKV